jgi:hypothetical protein
MGQARESGILAPKGGSRNRAAGGRVCFLSWPGAKGTLLFLRKTVASTLLSFAWTKEDSNILFVFGFS